MTIYVKIIQYIAYEKLDFAMKEIIYELLSIDTNFISELAEPSNSTINSADSANAGQLLGFSNLDLSASGNSSAFKTSKENLTLNPLKMEIGLRAFVLIADTLQQQKEANCGVLFFCSFFFKLPLAE